MLFRSKCLRELEEQGVVAARYSQIEVLNLPALERLALEAEGSTVPPGFGPSAVSTVPDS